MYKIGCCYLVFLIAVGQCFAQSPDIFRAEYMSMPKGAADVGFSRLKLLANVPIKLKSDDYIVLGADYSGITYDYGRELPFDSETIKNLYVIDINLAYVYSYNEDWRFIGVITPRLASNFSEGWQSQDFFLNVTIGGLKEKKNIEKPYKLVLGLSYNSSAAVQIPLPVVFYEKAFHPNWTYTIGVPKNGLKYIIKKKHWLQAEVILDGHYVNIQNGIMLPGNDTAAAVSSMVVLGNLGYQYKFTKDISIYGFFGRSIWQDGTLRDQDRKAVFTLNKMENLYFRTGVRIGI
jgi:hypothetical protein